MRALAGDWRKILPFGPFDLLFADGGPKLKGSPDGKKSIIKEEEVDAVLAALRPGGLLVLDDLTPERDWPPEWRGRPDPTRRFWLNDLRVYATELLVNPAGGRASGVILISRIE